MTRQAQRNSWSFILFLAVALTGTAFTAWQAARWASCPAHPPVVSNANVTDKPLTFPGWPAEKPALALILSAQEHGYIQKCGCSSPQLGGLERRYNFIQQLRDRGWPIVALDLGDVAYNKGLHEQALMKYTLSMRSLAVMGYVAVGVGKQEMSMPLLNALAEYTLQNPDAPPRVLSANLLEREKNFPGVKGSMVGDWLVTEGKDGRPKVGVVSVVGPSVMKDVVNDPSLKFQSNDPVLMAAMRHFDAHKADVRVLLYQGTMAEATRAAEMFPKYCEQQGYRPAPFDVVLAKTAEEEPSALPIRVPRQPAPGEPCTLVIGVGHKGRYVGVLGVYRGQAGKSWDFRYHLSPLGEEFDTPEGQEAANPVLQFLQEYAQELKDKDMLSRYPQTLHPAQVALAENKPTFVGSQVCKRCHGVEYSSWEKTAHGHAYEALEKVAKKPTLRQFDGECIVCHTVGFGQESGYRNERTTAHLKHVGCESCHGPGSLHANDPNNKTYRPHQSPWKSSPTEKLPKVELLQAVLEGKHKLSESEQKLVNRVSYMCQKCHDPDNDPHFRLEKYWPKIIH